jgi:hypothetical protein
MNHAASPNAVRNRVFFRWEHPDGRKLNRTIGFSAAC